MNEQNGYRFKTRSTLVSHHAEVLVAQLNADQKPTIEWGYTIMNLLMDGEYHNGETNALEIDESTVRVLKNIGEGKCSAAIVHDPREYSSESNRVITYITRPIPILHKESIDEIMSENYTLALYVPYTVPFGNEENVGSENHISREPLVFAVLQKSSDEEKVSRERVMHILDQFCNMIGKYTLQGVEEREVHHSGRQLVTE